MDAFGQPQMITVAATRRTVLINNDSGTDPALRCDRERISPLCLVENDETVVVNGETVHVVCPAEADGWFHTLELNEYGSNITFGQREAIQVTQRRTVEGDDEVPVFEEPEE